MVLVNYASIYFGPLPNAGSRNSGANSYRRGNNYFYRDFCDVNLVDFGYGIKGE